MVKTISTIFVILMIWLVPAGIFLVLGLKVFPEPLPAIIALTILAWFYTIEVEGFRRYGGRGTPPWIVTITAAFLFTPFGLSWVWWIPMLLTEFCLYFVYS
jgi:hypothetical protein